MKIIEQTSHKLTFQIYPWIFWLVGGLFIATGFVPSLFIGDQTLECDRATQRCQIERSTLWQTTSEQFSLNHLEAAEVDVSRDSDGDRTYRVLLQTYEGSIPLTTYFSSGRSMHSNQVQTINAFLQDANQPSLLIRQNDSWIGLLFSGVFTLLGGVMVVWAGKIVTCDFDKQAHQFTLKRRGILGTTTIQHPLHHIQSCLLERSRSSGSKATYRVSLMLRSGELIPLTKYYTSCYEAHAATENAIQSFLQIEQLQDTKEIDNASDPNASSG